MPDLPRPPGRRSKPLIEWTMETRLRPPETLNEVEQGLLDTCERAMADGFQRKLENAEEDIKRVAIIVNQIKPLLAGHKPEVQGAVLADCLAIWLAGHYVSGDEDATRKLRADMLAMHLLDIEALVSVNAKIMGTP